MLTRPEHDRVTNALVTLGRKAVGKPSRFSEEDEHGKQQWKSNSNIAVRKKLSVLPHHLSMVLRRLQYYQRLMKHPASHAQILSAYFGKLNFEFSDMVDFTGRINIGAAHPWLLQLHTDFDFLFDKVDDLSLDANIIDGRYFCLFSSAAAEADVQIQLAVEHVRDFDLSAIKPIC